MNVDKLKAIETRYHGCRFRSRREARWAVFFDSLGIEWEYEKEGFALPSGRYLPDFWLPRVQIGCWFEVKGESPTRTEMQLAKELADASGFPVYIFDQQPKADIVNATMEYHWNKTIKEVAADFLGWTKEAKEVIWNTAKKKIRREIPDEIILRQPRGIGLFSGHDHIYEDQGFVICNVCGSFSLIGGGSACYGPCYETDASVSPSRKTLLRQGAKTRFQEDILAKKCDAYIMKLSDMRRLESAFKKASEARFEFGENG